MKKFTILMIILDVIVASCFILVYAVPSFRNKIISTAMVTKTHKYIAYVFYDEDTINEVTSVYNPTETYILDDYPSFENITPFPELKVK